MIRKWMTLLLSLLLAVALPLTALADTQHTFTVVPGDLLASEQAIVDLLDAVDLRVTTGDASGALTVLINDQELVTLGLTADSTGLYANSELLGADVLYMTWEDGFAMLADRAKAMMQAQGVNDPAVMESIETSLQEVKTSIMTAVSAGAVTMPQSVTPVSMEESMEMLQEMFPDDAQMVEYVKGVAEGMTTEDGSFADENRDTADRKYSVTMGVDDVLALCDTQYMKAAIQESLTAQAADATQAELDEATETVLAEVKRLFEESNFAMTMDMYTLDEGMTLVGMDLSTQMTLDATDVEGEKLNMTMLMTADYDRLTDDEGVSYKANAAMSLDYQVIEVAFDLYRANSGDTEGMLGMLSGGEEIVVLYRAANTAADTRERGISVYMRSGATAILPPTASDRSVIGFTIKSEPAPAETLAALENATPDNSVDVLKLSDVEMQNLLSTISTNGMQVVYTALGQLPTSVLNLIISSTAE